MEGAALPLSLTSFETLPPIEPDADHTAKASGESSVGVGQMLSSDSGMMSSDSGSSFLGAAALHSDPAIASTARAAAPTDSQPDIGPIKRSRGGSLTTLLFTWASVATILAIWLWWTRPENPSGLENLPDDGKLNSGLVSPTLPLSNRLTIELGETKRVGDLEVTPLGIDFRAIKIVGPDGKQLYEPKTLVLRLRLKNVSAASTFHPTDPLFCTLVQRGRGPRKRAVMTRPPDGSSSRMVTPTRSPIRGAMPATSRRILPYDLLAVVTTPTSRSKIPPPGRDGRRRHRGLRSASTSRRPHAPASSSERQAAFRLGLTTVIGVPFERPTLS